jgi:hypothetical protein
MENEFVPYELALRLKALGFNKPCITWYDPQSNFNYKVTASIIGVNYNKKDIISAPTFSQAFRWIYDNYQNNEDILIAFLDMTAFNILYDNYNRIECLERLIEIVE